ncbi:hypothetical protein JCM10212_000641 [Sporobolomyces blumeae]
MVNKHDLTDTEGSDGPPSSAKRQRTGASSLPASTPPPLDSQPASDDDHDGEDDEASQDEEVNEEERRQVALIAETQRIKASNQKIAEAGVIKKVRLENFMCHYATEVDFGPQVNFLVGVNGSGKSAILTAITMALGGNAKATNRGTKGGDLIMEGKPSARCCVTLANRGEDAFENDVYGNEITIERTMNKTGGGGYKVKNADGKTVDTKKATLDKILDHFNIQVDNPMTVLTQDQSRQFLASASPKDKYNFFLRGTQLAQLTEEYEQIRANTETMEEALSRKKEVVPELKEAYRRAKDRAKEAEAALEQQGNLQILKDQLVWSYVDEVESQIGYAQEQINQEAAKGPRIQAAIKQLEDEKEEVERDIEVGKEAEAESKKVVEQHKPELDELRQRVAENKKRIQAFKDTERQLNGTLARHRAQLEDIMRQIASEEEKLSRDIDAERKPIREAIQNATDELEKIQFHLDRDMAKTDELEEAYRRHRDEYDAMTDTITSAGQAKENAVGRLRHVQAASKNRLLAFGQGCDRLLHAINGERGWRQKPIGPIGQHVKLNFPEYGKMLESYFSHYLNGFICVYPEDASRLRHMFKQNNIDFNTPILTIRPDDRFMADLRNGEPDPSILTVMRALTIDHPLVLQALVNSNRIEKSALVPRRPDGDNLMRTNPRNVDVAHSADMYQLRNTNGRSSSSSMTDWKGSSRLQADTSAQVAAITQEIQRIESDVNEFNRRKNEIGQQARQADQARKKHDASLREMQSRQRKVNNDIVMWKEKLAEEQPNNIAALRMNQAELEQLIETTVAQYAAGVEQKKREDQDYAPLVDRRNQLTNDVTRAESLISRIAAHMQSEYGKLSGIQTKLEQFKRDKQQHVDRLERYQAEVESLRETLRDRTEQASSVCDRPQVQKRKDARRLQKEIDSIEKALREREKRQGATLEQILEELAVRKKVAQEAVQQTNDLSRLVKALDEAWQSRTQRWTDFRAHIAHRARLNFISHLGNRGFHGKLKFDHDHNQLHIAVQTDATEKGSQKAKRKDAKSLSGGEKSFSTICLLLTMWEAVGCPLRCLDEFDVFMDAINRRISMSMIIDTAKAAEKTQFILITPQDMGSLKWGDEVRVSKLEDPKRAAGALARGR